MLKFNRLRKRARGLVVAAAASGMVMGNVASVAALNDSSLTLSDPRTGETGVTYTLSSNSFDTGTTIRCISLDFNDQSDGAGAVPTGLTTTGASLDAASTLITPASWTESFASNGALDITFGTGETPAANGTLVYTGITNGDTENTTYFALLNTYTNADCSTGQTDTATVAFVYKDGELVTLTIDPTLTFTCTGVGSGQNIHGGTYSTSIDTSGGGINYGNNVTSSTNGISAHDIDVSTNASGGYIVYIRHTGSLTNAASDTIDNHTGTNLAPSNFAAAGTEAWGYTTEDATLSAVGDGADRFTNTDEWAGFTTTNEEVVVNTAATTGTETTRIGHQVGVANTTEAGTYNTTVVYTIVATF